MSASEPVDFDPPYLHPDYRSSLLRAPRRPLVRLPDEWFHHAVGPAFGRIPVKPEDAGQGQRVYVIGRAPIGAAPAGALD